MTDKQIVEIAIKHQRQMRSVHPHAIIGTIEDAIKEALKISSNVPVSGSGKVCPDCGDYGIIQDEHGNNSTCPCHYR